MTVAYNSKKIIPAPLVNIQKEYVRTGDGHLIGSNFVLTLTGKLMPNKGSPNSSGVFWTVSGYPADEVPADKHSSLLVKYAALKNLFATEGQSLEFQAQDGSTPLRCYPRMRGFSVEEGLWVDYINYTITFEVPELFSAISSEDFSVHNDFFFDGVGSGDRLFLQNVQEAWNLEEGDSADSENPHSYRVSHNVSAVGKEVYGADGKYSNGWEQARRWVISHIGIDNNFLYSTSGLNLPAYFTPYNHVKSENTDEMGGSYGISETWILMSGTATEEFSVSTTSRANEALTNVSIEGRLGGMEVKTGDTVTTTKYSAADARFDALYAGYPNNIIYQRAVQYSEKGNLNSIPLSMVIGRNPVGGTVSYNFEYNTRPPNYINGSLYEEFNFQYGNPPDIFGSIPVLGRALGPVLQDMGTVGEKTISLSCQVIMPSYSGASPATTVGMTAMLAASPKTSVETIFNSFYNSLALSYNDLYKREDGEQWNPFNGSYSRSVMYVYQ